MESPHHIFEHLLLFPGECRYDGLHLTRVEVGDEEQVTEEDVGINEAGPREEVDEALLVVGHAVQPLSHGRVVSQDVLLAEPLLEDVGVHVRQKDGA